MDATTNTGASAGSLETKEREEPRWTLQEGGEANRNSSPTLSPTLSPVCDYIDCTYDHLTAQTISILLPGVAHELHWNWNESKWTGKFKIPPSIFKDQIFCEAQFRVDGTLLPPFNLYKRNRNSYLIKGSTAADTSITYVEDVDKMEDPRLVRERRMAHPLSLPNLSALRKQQMDVSVWAGQLTLDNPDHPRRSFGSVRTGFASRNARLDNKVLEFRSRLELGLVWSWV